jgi:YD repeat-containing protein
VAQTTYGYDEYALNPSGVSTQRNATPSNGNVRGNQTSIHHWLKGTASATSSCPVSVSNGFVVSYALYNDSGTVYKSTDACGSSAGEPNHTTTHTYSSSYAGAYPTQTCSPTVNNITQCVTGTYDVNTGLLASFTDANSQTTNYSYDNRWRVTQALFPAIDTSGVRPETDFYYPNTTTVQRCKKQNDNSSSSACGTGWIVNYAYFDGLGRTKQMRLADPAGDDYVDTTYDTLGRVSTVSNPHRSASSSTDGAITSHYDALSRVTSVTRQDGSTSSVQYDLAAGTTNCTIATDEAGKQRKTCSDGLGRLTSIWEDPAGLNYETDYQYNPWATCCAWIRRARPRATARSGAPACSLTIRSRNCSARRILNRAPSPTNMTMLET